MSFHFRPVGIIALVLLVACGKKDSNISDPFDPATAKTLQNVAYGSRNRQVADVYLPANRSATATKTLILVHGGSWVSGDKADMATFIPLIKAAVSDAAIININYTLADGNAATQFPAQMADFDSLFQYLNKQADVWHVSTSYSLIGVSAGGHLSLLYSYAFDNKKQVRLVASIVGPTNLTDDYYTTNILFQSVLTNFLGQPYSANAALHTQASPAFRLTNVAPATYMAYGGADPLVPTSNAILLEQKLKLAKVPYMFDFFASESHEFTSQATAATIASLTQFWRQQVR